MSYTSILKRVSDYTSKYGEHSFSTPNILVVGVGGAGCNAVTRMKKLGLSVPTIAINTDLAHLRTVDADKKILLKASGTRGTGGNAELGEKSAILARDKIREMIKNTDVVFLATGLGGGTGTGASPVIAEIAKDEGSLVISIVTLPFTIEKVRMKKAREGLKKLMKVSNTVIVMENEKLIDLVPNRPLNEAFMVMDHLISYTIMSFVDMIVNPSLINVDFGDLRSVMERGLLSTILISEGDIRDTRKIITDALNNPFMNMDYSTADGALIHITVGEDAPLELIYSTVDTISSFLKKDANITIGARVEPEYYGRMRLLVILTNIRVPFVEKEKKAEVEEKFGIFTVR